MGRIHRYRPRLLQQRRYPGDRSARPRSGRQPGAAAPAAVRGRCSGAERRLEPRGGALKRLANLSIRIFLFSCIRNVCSIALTMDAPATESSGSPHDAGPGFLLLPMSCAEAFDGTAHAHAQLIMTEVAELIVTTVADHYQITGDDVGEGLERMVSYGHDGTPLIGEFLAAELGPLLGISPGSAIAKSGRTRPAPPAPPALAIHRHWSRPGLAGHAGGGRHAAPRPRGSAAHRRCAGDRAGHQPLVARPVRPAGLDSRSRSRRRAHDRAEAASRPATSGSPASRTDMSHCGGEWPPRMALRSTTC